MTTSIAICGFVLLGLVTAVFLEPSDCDSDVLAGTNTPVYAYRPKKIYLVNHDFVRQRFAMYNVKKQSSFFNESGSGKNGSNNECPKFEEWSQERTFPMNGTAPSTIYPKIVVVVDHGIYQRYGDKSDNLTKLLEHVLAVWNAVDLNFRTLEDPKMRLNIAGIIIEDHPNALPFLVNTTKDGWLDAEVTMNSLSRFLKLIDSFWSYYLGNYHIITVMTSKKIYGNIVHGEAAVSASYDSLCRRNVISPPQILLFADDEDWTNIRALSWILGETFKSTVAERNGLTCPGNKSAVMTAYSEGTKNLPDWSKCFLDSFKMRFNTREAKCFFEKPKVRSPLPRVLPGQLMGCDDQCRIREGSTCCVSVDSGKSICEELWCAYGVGCVYSGIPAADGTKCGDGKICFRRKCVFRGDIEM